MDPPCQKHCTSVDHGDQITSALTKRGISDTQLWAYMNHICHLCESSKDSQKRTALQMAASCGRTEICKWLCKKNSNIDEKDFESGYTALHRSVFYGKIDIAATLIKLGANANILDKNDLTPLEHAMKDNLMTEDKGPNEQIIYVWGSNSNYTLGPLQSHNTPDILHLFHKTYPKTSVRQICLEKFHCVIVTMDGDVYSYGHGQGGRLGLGSEATVLEPTNVRLSSRGMASPIVCKKAAIARDHSIFLTESNHVWTCGLNNNFVLGLVPPPPQLLVPRPLPAFKQEITGVCCGRFHSVAWGPKCIYTWGLNAGQLGHDRNNETNVYAPKMVTSLTQMDVQFVNVAASNGATAIATTRGDIYVLHEFQCRKIASRQLSITSLDIIGGKLAMDNQLDQELKVVALTKKGNILIWQESDPQLLRCIFSINRCLHIVQVILNVLGIVFVTMDREVFKGKMKPRKRKNVDDKSKDKGIKFNNFLDKSECVMVTLEKVPKLHGALYIECDLEGQNFAALQQNTTMHITKIPKISPSTISEDINNLLVTCDESDTLNDVVFKVKNRRFPAHRYIIANCSEKLLNTASNSNLIEIENMEPDIFEQILKYIYMGHCDLTKQGKCPEQLVKLCQNDEEKLAANIIDTDKTETSDLNNSKKSAFEIYNKKKKIVQSTDKKKEMDPIRLLQEAAKRLGVGTLQKDLDNFSYSHGMITIKSGKKYTPHMPIFDYNKFTEYYDVSIKSKNGRVIDAHKCVLAARADYFNNMFSNRWNETNSKSELSLPYPQNLLTHLINFLYTDEVINLELEDIESISNLLVLADHFLIPRLCEICEYTLSKLITFNNVMKIIELAHVYNAEQLKIACMEFICRNLAAVLESRHLETIDEAIWLELTNFYYSWNSNMCYRVITPFSNAICDEALVEISDLHPFDFQLDRSPEVAKTAPKTSQRKRHRSYKLSASDKSEAQKSSPIVQRESYPTEEKQVIENEKIVPSRLQAITVSLAKLEATEDDLEFVRLSSKFANNSRTSFSEDFPDLGTSVGSGDGYVKTPRKYEKNDKHKIIKMSQKQMKRLSQENGQQDCSNASPESPKNPWKVLEPITPVGSKEEAKININKIIIEEKKQKENLVKIRSKLLVFTQMEDKALEELCKFYNTENVFDEIIIPQRVEIGLMAAPVWVNKSNHS